MINLCGLIWFAFIGLFRSRASLEAEILALRRSIFCGAIHQSGRPSAASTGWYLPGGMVWLLAY
jgi:hypothetical protein